MQILTRFNKVIAYNSYGYTPVGNTAVCATTKEYYDDVLITEVDCVPTDIDMYEYYYIDGKFIKGRSNSEIRETNAREKFQFWVGTISEFEALAKKEEGTLYIISDDTTLEEINTEIDKIKDGTTAVGKATNATNATKATNATYTDFTNGYSYDSQTTDEDGEYVKLPSGGGVYLIRAKDNRDDIQFLVHDISDGAFHAYFGITKCYMDTNNGFTIANYYATIDELRKLRINRNIYRLVDGMFKQIGGTNELSFKAQCIR